MTQFSLDPKEAMKFRDWISVSVLWKGQDQTCIYAICNDTIFVKPQWSAGELLL